VAEIEQLAKPLAQCGPFERWPGLLVLALGTYRQAEQPVAAAEARLDHPGKACPGVRILDTLPGLGPKTPEAVVARPENSGRFKSGNQMESFRGLVRLQFLSGEDDRRAANQRARAGGTSEGPTVVHLGHAPK
jgi:hypothetical protein